MYGITNYMSFEIVLYWIEEIKKLSIDLPTILIGNKCDLEYFRIISKDKGEELSKITGFHFYESSNKECINIYEPIYDLAEQILKKREEIKRIENIKPDNAIIKKIIKNNKDKEKTKFENKDKDLDKKIYIKGNKLKIGEKKNLKIYYKYIYF